MSTIIRFAILIRMVYHQKMKSNLNGTLFGLLQMGLCLDGALGEDQRVVIWKIIVMKRVAILKNNIMEQPVLMIQLIGSAMTGFGQAGIQLAGESGFQH